MLEPASVRGRFALALIGTICLMFISLVPDVWAWRHTVLFASLPVLLVALKMSAYHTGLITGLNTRLNSAPQKSVITDNPE